jgi:signal transduction histidine kinase
VLSVESAVGSISDILGEGRGMATGTSPLAGDIFGWTYARLWPGDDLGAVYDWKRLIERAASLHLVGLAATMTMGWHDPTAAAGSVGTLGTLQLAFLMATGAAAAFLTFRRSDDSLPPRAVEDGNHEPGVSELLAQMSHELRTPLNAMIGFSEVMLRELHGPLGHARYQEYASHINESGGRLLKASEDTLAVTATMSALMANRASARRQRVLAATLLQKAWGTVCGQDGALALHITNCSNCEIECERRATEQALEHLLREAVSRVPAGGRIEAKGRRRGSARSIELRIAGRPETSQVTQDPYVAGTSLRVVLARLLLEMQGASLSLWEDDNGWAACVAFPPRS